MKIIKLITAAVPSGVETSFVVILNPDNNNPTKYNYLINCYL
jgi:hypothetical protein